VSEPHARLRPARPDSGGDRPAYLPRIPWVWIALGALGLGVVAGGYWLKEQRRANELRADILRVHEQLSDASERYLAFRTKLEGWIQAAASAQPRQHVDERLNLAGLRSGNGLYLRLSAADAKDPEGIDKGARAMDVDAIGKCLGLTPASARGLWERGDFLMPSWIDQAHAENGVMRLRVLDEMLARRIRNDLPSVLALLDSQWFMLVLQQGETRRDHPVDVFLWDVKRGERLLSARVQASGMLVPIRNAIGEGPAGPRPPAQLTSGAATDCSIASQLKALTGVPDARMHAAVPGQEDSAGATADGGVPDGGLAPATPTHAADETPAFEE